jgi:hypothetical protein
MFRHPTFAAWFVSIYLPGRQYADPPMPANGLTGLPRISGTFMTAISLKTDLHR